MAIGLPAPSSPRLTVERDLRVPMADGAVLLADRYTPQGAGPMPTVLVRSPLRTPRGATGLLYGVLFAQQGLQVVIQSTRGSSAPRATSSRSSSATTGSATIAWLRAPALARGARVGDGRGELSGAGRNGPSPPPRASALGAIAPAVTASQFQGATQSGGLALESMATWHAMVDGAGAPVRVAADGRLPDAAAARVSSTSRWASSTSASPATPSPRSRPRWRRTIRTGRPPA